MPYEMEEQSDGGVIVTFSDPADAMDLFAVAKEMSDRFVPAAATYSVFDFSAVGTFHMSVEELHQLNRLAIVGPRRSPGYRHALVGRHVVESMMSYADVDELLSGRVDPNPMTADVFDDLESAHAWVRAGLV